MATLIPTKDRIPARERRRSAFERSVAVLRAFRQVATPEEMERIATRLEEALQPPPVSPVSPERQAFLDALTGGRTYTEKERLESKATSLARYFQWRQKLLADCLSAPQVASLLDTSRQTPHDRAKAGTLLAVRAKGGLRFPRWQFDESGPDGVLPHLPDVLKALDIEPLDKVSWFVHPNVYLDGCTPLEVLKAGDWECLVSLARAVGVN